MSITRSKFQNQTSQILSLTYMEEYECRVEAKDVNDKRKPVL